VANQLGPEELKRLARLGAQARLEQIEAERSAILRTFPGLGATRVTIIAESGVEAPAEASKRRKRRKMTAAEKQVASERMKKYWAARRQLA
jgi:hypothetical protein